MRRLALQLRRRPFTTARLLPARPGFPCCSTDDSVSPVGGGERDGAARRGRWLTLPRFAPPLDVPSVGKELLKGRRPPEPTGASTTALKWVRRCCPHLPVSLVQKLFRLRQVRRETVNTTTATCLETQLPQCVHKRVSGKELMKSGDLILLPVTVQEEFLPEKTECCFNGDAINYMRALELYRDEAIIAVNKPPGMPVQGGAGIKLSMDSLAGSCLRYDYPEPPRLVHRLDRESSGILLLGRTQTSASILHSIFREKTYGAFDEIGNDQRIFKKTYWALVIGSPKCSKGLVTTPLRKVVLENAKSERITIAKSEGHALSQHAVTEYKVIGSTHGLTWLELCPLTGRKHQLRVHCAEALGTPIVGDFKYGWSGHRKWQPLTLSDATRETGKACGRSSPFGLDLEGGSVVDQKPRLHLHCRQMILPNVSVVLQQLDSSAGSHDFSRLQSIELVAPLPSHMEKSFDVLKYSALMDKSFGSLEPSDF